MGQGRGRVLLPGQNGGMPGQVVDVGQVLMAIVENLEWPTVSEWVVLQESRIRVIKLADGTRIMEILTQGCRRGYRIPLNGINAAVIARELGSGEALMPESDEVAAAQAPAPFEALPTDDDPPQPPTMGQ